MGGIILAGLVCVVTAFIGLWKNERERERLAAEYNILMLFAAGIFGVMILVGMIVLASGTGGIPLILLGIAGTIIFELSWLKSSQAGLVKEWIRCTLWGIGKVSKFVLYCTIIGIIPVKMIQNSIQTLDYLDRRTKAQYEKDLKEELRRQAEMQKLIAEAELQLMEERGRNRK